MSWRQLKDIRKADREEREDEKNRPPVACPNDGGPLEILADGTRHCVFDGWVWKG